jgi:hypothetical protein
MFLKQLYQFMLQYYSFKAENIAKQQKCRELCNTRDVTDCNQVVFAYVS